MAVLDPTTRPKPKIVDKEWIRRELDKHDARTGFVPVPGATAEMAQKLIAQGMRARGIDPDQIAYVQDRNERESD